MSKMFSPGLQALGGREGERESLAATPSNWGVSQDAGSSGPEEDEQVTEVSRSLPTRTMGLGFRGMTLTNTRICQQLRIALSMMVTISLANCSASESVSCDNPSQIYLLLPL